MTTWHPGSAAWVTVARTMLQNNRTAFKLSPPFPGCLRLSKIPVSNAALQGSLHPEAADLLAGQETELLRHDHLSCFGSDSL